MVSRITLFEPHFEGVSFGPRSRSESTDSKAEQRESAEKSTVIKLLQGGAVFLVLFILLYIVFSKLTNDSAAEETDVELDSW